MDNKVSSPNSNEKAPLREMLIGQLLFSEKPREIKPEQAKAALERHLGEVEPVGDKPDLLSFAVKKYKVVFKELPQGASPLASILTPKEGGAAKLDDIARTQLWDMKNGAEFLDSVKYEAGVFAMLSAGLPYKEQAELFLGQLDAALELYPTANAIFVPGSGKLTPTEKFVADRKWSVGERFINAAVNARFFTVQDTEDMVVDTLGMYMFALPEVQVHFHGLDPNHVVSYVYNILSYQFDNDFPVKSGDTIDGIGQDGIIDAGIQWQAHFEDSLIQPARLVLDINCGRFAAGQRN